MKLPILKAIYHPIQYVITGENASMGEDVWEKVWKKDLITSDYSLKYLDFMQGIEKSLAHGSAGS